MADFSLYAPKLRQFEGGFVNDPDDAGGATMCGVTLKTYQAWYGRKKTVEDLKRMTDREWREIMKNGYWDRCMADCIRNQSVAELLVDWCVNSGAPAIKAIQRLVGADVDGIVGIQTLGAINAQNPAILHANLKFERELYYRNLVKRKPQNEKFLKGWLNRVNDFMYEAQQRSKPLTSS